MKDPGEVSQYLGTKITSEDGVIKDNQKQCMKHILKRFDVLIWDNDNRLSNTPMERDLKLTKAEGKDMTIEKASYATKFPNQNIIRTLLYLFTHTCPDIEYAVGVLSKFMKTPNYHACKAVTRILIYLWGTLDVGIIFSGSTLNLNAFSDADWVEI